MSRAASLWPRPPGASLTERPTLVPLPALIADIGGTNARFAIFDRSGSADFAITVATADFPTLEDAILAAVLPQAPDAPRSAVLALAAPIRGEAVPLTNCPWIVAPNRLIAELGFDEVILLNDFEALSLSLPGLAAADLDQIGPGDRELHGNRLVVGPGTGLGAAALLNIGNRWVPLPGEGGHVDFGPRTERDGAIWPHIERLGGRVSAETLLSGQGLVRIHRAIAAGQGQAADPLSPAEITARAAAGSDIAAVETLDLFAAYLGRFAGDLALVFLPTGGVYLGGGITGRIAPFLKRPGFREAFIDKAPHRAILEEMATAIITHPNPALAGIADFVRAPERFNVRLEGKRWRA